MTANEDPDRGGWSSHLDYLLSSMGYAVGLGNVWRFPYLAYRNGGASFLIPYVFILLTAGLPLFLLETSLGQFTSEGALTCWGMAPLFTGLGYAMVVSGTIVSIYYNMLIAYSLYYMMASFVSLDESVPWKYCHNSWNTPQCRRERFPQLDDDKEVNASMKLPILWDIFYNQSCVADALNASTYEDFSNGESAQYETFISQYFEEFPNSTGDLDTMTWREIKGYHGFKICAHQYTTPSEEYFERQVLGVHKSPDFDDLGDLSYKLVASLALAWILIFACLLRGIKTSGKVVYFTALFPYFVLTVLLIKGLTLNGSEDGIDFYVVPEWDKLTETDVWGDAANQIFYSLGIAFGGQLTMSSYNKFDNNVIRDSMLVAFINCGTSVFAGFAIFSLLGHMAHVTGKDVEDVATSGPGLAFVAYPDGISRLGESPVWGFLFFFMLLTLGMDSQFAMIETLISGLGDISHKVIRKHKTFATFVACLVGFTLGLPQCTDGGIRVLTLLDDYAGSYNLFVISLLEIICVSYVYGLSNFAKDLEMMVGYKPGVYWLACWGAITPVVVIFNIVVTATQHEKSEYDGQKFPDWADALGWASCWFSILCLLLVSFWHLCHYGWPECIQPAPSWGPARPEDRIGRYCPLDEEGGAEILRGEFTHLRMGVNRDTLNSNIASTDKTSAGVCNGENSPSSGYGACESDDHVYDIPSY